MKTYETVIGFSLDETSKDVFYYMKDLGCTMPLLLRYYGLSFRIIKL